MQTKKKHRKDTCGQTLVLALFFLGLCTILLLGLFRVSSAVQEKIRLQLSADLAVLSALNCQANGLNTIALANRAILANDALAAQLNAMVSETTFYRRLVEKFKKLLRFIPYAGAASSFLTSGIHLLEKAVRRAASLTLPLAHYSNKALRKGQETVRYLLPLNSLKAARATLKENVPRARLTAVSEALLLRQARSLQKSLRETGPGATHSVRARTMDHHTLKRNWRVRVAGLSPAKKTGGTSITTDDLVAQDSLDLKVFKRLRWRWKTVLKARSRASDFGYQPPADFLSLKTEDPLSVLSLPILVRSEMPAFTAKSPSGAKELMALSAGRLVYKRDSREDEIPNVFNPFWKAELAPVAEDPDAKKIVPENFLKEVRH